jgi:hypothetical protein
MAQNTAPPTLSLDSAPSSQAGPSADANPPQTLALDANPPQTLNLDTDTNQPGAFQRAADVSGAAGLGKLGAQEIGYLGTMPARTYNRVQGLHQAYEAMKTGDLKKASMIAHTLAAGPDDPISKMAMDIIKMPFQEASEAYKSLRDKNLDDTTSYLTAAQHGIRSIPLIGAGAEQVGSNIAEDLHNNNWSGLSGDLAGALPALLFGAEGKAAEAAEASGAEGAAEAAQEAKVNAIRPSQRMIGRTPVPVTALQDANPSLSARTLEATANNPAVEQAKFAAQKTQPAAVNATVNNLEDVARNHIQQLRDELGDHTPFEKDMSTLRKQSGAMKDAAQEVYKKFDKASNEDQQAYNTRQALNKEAFDQEQAGKEKTFNDEQTAKKEAFDQAEQAKVTASANTPAPYKAKPFKAEKFEGDDFEPEDRPLTFRELQTQRAEAMNQMKAGTSPAAYKAGQDQLRNVEQQMDDFAEKHADVVSPEEYNAANAARKAAGQHDFIADRLKIDTGTDQIPANITKSSLKTLPQAFDKTYGEGAFAKYLGPEGIKNYNAVRDVLQSDPQQASLLLNVAKLATRHAVGAGAGYMAGGIPGALAGDVLQYTAGRIAENLLFNPEYGQTVLAAYRAARPVVQGIGQIGPTQAWSPNAGLKGPTHIWSPANGVQPVQQQ